MARNKTSRAVRKQKNGKTNNQIYTDKSHRSNQGSSAQNMTVDDSEQTGLQMEYAAVRDEAILLMEEHNNQLVNVFVVGVAFLTLTYSVEEVPTELFLLMYVLMIPMQILINNKAYMLARCGAYIETMIEPKIKGLNWESVIGKADERFNKEYKLSIGKFQMEHRTCVYGTFFFSFIALISYIFSYVSIDSAADSYITVHLHLPQIAGIIWCIAGTIITFRLCKKGFQISKVKGIYSKIFSDAEMLQNPR
ncbi:MAG: hypothetical protein ACLRTI_10005 [Blautia sp.]